MLNYRLAVAEDIMLYFAWANDKDVRNNSFNSSLIGIEEHQKWFKSKLQSKNSTLLIFLLDNLEIGQVRIEKEHNYGLINFSIANKFRGKGLSTKILNQACDYYLKNNNKIILKGLVKKDNLASQKTFRKAGFNEVKTGTHFEYTRGK